MSRYLLILGVALMLSVMFSGAVYAASPVEDLVLATDKLVTALKPLLEIIFGGLTGVATESELLFAKILLLILVFAVVYVALERAEFFSSNRGIHWITSIVVALLSTRWLGDKELIQTILLPYSALGVTLSAAIPFVLGFVLIEMGMKKATAFMRRVAWIGFAVVFFALWYIRYDLLGGYQYIYIVVAGLAVMMAIYDGTFQRLGQEIELEKALLDPKHKARRELTREMAQLIEDKGKGLISDVDYRAEMAHIKSKLRAVG